MKNEGDVGVKCLSQQLAPRPLRHGSKAFLSPQAPVGPTPTALCGAEASSPLRALPEFLTQSGEQ